MIAYAKHILGLIEAKHSKDLVVPECKDGPTQSVSEYLRMDAWVMNRSWAHPCYTAYEIKCTRSDFLSDKKWRGYLPYCNEFYFVAPKGIIEPTELPPEAGLLVMLGGAEGKKLVCKKKAAWRDVEVPESLFRYVLMCRVQVARNGFDVKLTKAERAKAWKAFVKEKVATRALGYEVSKSIREKVGHVQNENESLKRQMERYDDVRQFLDHIGVVPDSYVSRYDVQRRMEDQESVFDKKLILQIEQLRSRLSATLETVAEIEAKNGSPVKKAAFG